jgi:hypothetical protein
MRKMDLESIRILMDQSTMGTGVMIVVKERARLLIRMGIFLKVISMKINRRVVLNGDSGALMVLSRTIN